jgi:glucose/arabinose dehydrogenase
LGVVTDFAFLDATRTIVANKDGRVLLIKNGQIQWERPFADFRPLVGAAAGDRGLLSVEPHPQFPRVPYLYVSYQKDLTPTINPGGPRQNIVSRYTVVGDHLDMASEKILIGDCKLNTTSWHGGDCLPCVGNTHGTNQVFFGPDEQLYVAVGDGEIQEGYFWWGRGVFDVPYTWLAAVSSCQQRLMFC